MADDDDAFTKAWNESWSTIGAGVGGCLPWLITIAIAILIVVIVFVSCDRGGAAQSPSTPMPVLQTAPPAPAPVAVPRPATASQSLPASPILTEEQILTDAFEALKGHGKVWSASHSPAGDNAVAWHWATCPVEGHRNPQKAVEYALQAMQTKPTSSMFSDTLAAAYASVGMFDSAVEWQQAAIERFRAEPYPSDERLNTLRNRLRIYQDRRPYLADEKGN
jgi:hypothetical protein